MLSVPVISSQWKQNGWNKSKLESRTVQTLSGWGVVFSYKKLGVLVDGRVLTLEEGDGYTTYTWDSLPSIPAEKLEQMLSNGQQDLRRLDADDFAAALAKIFRECRR